MNYIQELLKKHCVGGVEYKALGELFHIRNGYTPSKAKKEYWENGTIPWFRMDDIRTNGRILADSIQHITREAVKGGKLFPANSIIISTTATIGEHALIIVDSLANQRFTCLSPQVNCCEILNMKFFYYYCFILGEWCRNNVNVSGFASVDMKKFKQFKIPIPPLIVQEEIVRILDTFTELEKELEKELEARKKQYAYYREKLLSFDYLDSIGGGAISYMSLGEICERINKISWSLVSLRGEAEAIQNLDSNTMDCHEFDKSNSRNDRAGSNVNFHNNNAESNLDSDNDRVRGKADSSNDNKTFKYIDLTSVSRDFNKIVDFQIINKNNAPSRAQQIIKTNDVLFATTRPTLHRFCIVDKEFNEQICSTGFCVLRAKQDVVLPKWVMHCIATQKCLDFVEKHQEGASYPSISDNKFKQFKIPIPPLEIQEKIVSILDTFESLTNDLSKGLPAEIQARKKQYEYYREKLLSFEKYDKI